MRRREYLALGTFFVTGCSASEDPAPATESSPTTQPSTATDTRTETATPTPTPTPAPEAEFEVRNLTRPNATTVGNPARLNFSVANVGDAGSELRTNATVSGMDVNAEATIPVSLGTVEPGNDSPVNLNYVPRYAGTYRIQVPELNVVESIEVSPATPAMGESIVLGEGLTITLRTITVDRLLFAVAGSRDVVMEADDGTVFAFARVEVGARSGSVTPPRPDQFTFNSQPVAGNLSANTTHTPRYHEAAPDQLSEGETATGWLGFEISTGDPDGLGLDLNGDGTDDVVFSLPERQRQRIQDPAQFEVFDRSIPGTVPAWDSWDASISVVNGGESGGTFRALVKREISDGDWEVIDRFEEFMPAHRNKTFSWSYDAGDPGETRFRVEPFVTSEVNTHVPVLRREAEITLWGDLRLGTREFTARDSIWLSSDPNLRQEAADGFHYLMYEIEIENLTDDSIREGPLDSFTLESGSKRFSPLVPSSQGQSLASPSGDLYAGPVGGSLAPTERMVGWIVFEAPDDIRDATLRWTSSGSRPERTVEWTRNPPEWAQE